MAKRSAAERDGGSSLASDLARARIDRLRGGGFSGMQAGTIGSVLVGCIALGFFFGQWLDTRAHTTYWMPVMTLLGIAAGFRHMFVTIKQVTEYTKAQKAESDAARRLAASQKATVSQSMGIVSDAPALKLEDAASQAEATRVRPRIFSVPPPPQSSFTSGAPARGARSQSPRMSTHAGDEEATSDADRRDLTERLLDLQDPNPNDDRPSSQ